jgi:transcriptional regulator with XRE-family HTH domain
MNREAVQRERLKNVLGFLREKGTTQREVADAIGEGEETLSSWKSGKVKNIPPQIADVLEEKYEINPEYLFGTSEEMRTFHIKELRHFDQFVKGWNTVERSGKEYLHLHLDQNFYNFLIEVSSIRKIARDGFLLESEGIRNAAHLNGGEPNIQEFVLLPKNNFLEILRSAKEDKEKLDDVIDFIEHIGYLEAEETDCG